MRPREAALQPGAISLSLANSAVTPSEGQNEVRVTPSA